MIKFKDEFELKFWCSIYQNTCSSNASSSTECWQEDDTNAAADSADVAILEVRKRMPADMSGTAAAAGGSSKESTDGNSGGGQRYLNSPKR